MASSASASDDGSSDEWEDYAPLPSTLSGLELLGDDIDETLRAAAAANAEPEARAVFTLQLGAVAAQPQQKSVKVLGGDEGRALRRLQRSLRGDMHRLHLLCLLARSALAARACNDADVQAAGLSLLPEAALDTAMPAWDRVREAVRLFRRQIALVAQPVDVSAQLQPQQQQQHHHHGSSAATAVLLGDSESDDDQKDKDDKEAKANKGTAVGGLSIGPAAAALGAPAATAASTTAAVLQSEAEGAIMVISDDDDDNEESHGDSGGGEGVRSVRNDALRAAAHGSGNCESLAVLFVAALRGLGMQARLVQALRPVSQKVPHSERVGLEPSPKKARRTNSATQQKRMRAIRARTADPADLATRVEWWSEVYIAKQKRWVPASPAAGHMNQPARHEADAGGKLLYVVAAEEDGHFTDVTPRYAQAWLASGYRQRAVDPAWWAAALRPHETRKGLAAAGAETGELEQHQLAKGLPTTLTAYKKHALYALERYLTQAEGVRPGAKVVGYCRGESVFLRHDVQPLKSADAWLREGRRVQKGEQPFKRLPARRRSSSGAAAAAAEASAATEANGDETGDRNGTGHGNDDDMRALFGKWQTEVAMAQPVREGKVPTNKFGTVDLFRKVMLPPGAVHLAGRPGIARLAKALSIHAPEAVVDFEYRAGRMLPIKDGVVVAKEHAETLSSAWAQAMQAEVDSAHAEREARATANWQSLVRRALIFLRLKEQTELRREM